MVDDFAEQELSTTTARLGARTNGGELGRIQTRENGDELIFGKGTVRRPSANSTVTRTEGDVARNSLGKDGTSTTTIGGVDNNVSVLVLDTISASLAAGSGKVRRSHSIEIVLENSIVVRVR